MNPLFQHIEFLTGAHKLSQAPSDAGLEVAFAGRSNAGKSRAINAITGINTLARVSKTPGRTQQINFFALDANRRLVDLPGYGYAKVPEQMRRHWVQTLEQYLQLRTSLQGLILVMDIRHPLMPGDVQMLDGCHAMRMPVHILLTKADKLSKGAASASRASTAKALAKRYGPPPDAEPGEITTVQLFSALTPLGIEAAGQRLAAWLQLDPDTDKKNPDSKGGKNRG